MKRTIAIEPKVAIPGVVVALALTLTLGWKLGSGSASSSGRTLQSGPNALTGAAVAATPVASPGALPALPAATTPDAILAAIPDPATLTGGNAEVRRWRERARTSPKNPQNWVNLGDALMQRSRDAVDSHDYDWARLCYGQALQLDPKRAPALAGLAWVACSLHQFEDGIAYARKAIELAPHDTAAYGLMGDAQVEMGQYDAAFETYQKMLDIRPDMSSYSRGAHLLFLTGDTRKAVWLMGKAIKAGGDYKENTAWCKAQLAEMLWSVGAILPAESVVKDGLKDAPNNYHLLTMLGRVEEGKRHSKEAEAAYKKAIDASPQHAALVALGDLYLSQGRKDDAEKMYAGAEAAYQHHQAHGNHDKLFMARFWADHDRNLDQAKAVVAERLAAQGEPKSLADLDTVAWVYYKLGDIAEAKRFIDKTIGKGQPDAARLFHAGMIYAKAGEDVKGEGFLADALNRNPMWNPLQVKVAADMIHTLGAKPNRAVSPGNVRKG